MAGPALFHHERITTTEAKAKAIRGLPDGMITLAKRESLHARRQVLRLMPDETVVKKLFDTVAARYGERHGGYTRIIKAGKSVGRTKALCRRGSALGRTPCNGAATAARERGLRCFKSMWGVRRRRCRSSSRERARPAKALASPSAARRTPACSSARAATATT
ncbi:MAG: 50S ribosomal protein L17 [Candidatus Rokubacteria bacterium]|nr:50S ribosomal protein L17 [Candidatus Rokubacteria bacterium]